MRIIKQEPSKLVIKNSNILFLLFISLVFIGVGLVFVVENFLKSGISGNTLFSILFVIAGFLLFFLIKIEILIIDLGINQLTIIHKKILKNKTIVYPADYVKKIIMREMISRSSKGQNMVCYPLALILNDGKNPDFELVFPESMISTSKSIFNRSIKSSRKIGQTLAMFINGVPFEEERSSSMPPITDVISAIKDIVVDRINNKK